MVDYLRYYHLEIYLFEEVHARFHADGSLPAFDFFSIVIWKANRAKSKVAKRLMTRSPKEGSDLEGAVRLLTAGLFQAPSGRERLRLLMQDWGFHLPMATALLTVMWPEEFTVYDVRACEQLGDFEGLGNLSRFDRIWPEYQRYLEAVLRKAQAGLSLRDADRYLWAKSSAGQLQRDIESGFSRPEDSP